MISNGHDLRTVDGWARHCWEVMQEPASRKVEWEANQEQIEFFQPVGRDTRETNTVNITWESFDACKSVEEFIELFETELGIANLKGASGG